MAENQKKNMTFQEKVEEIKMNKSMLKEAVNQRSSIINKIDSLPRRVDHRQRIMLEKIYNNTTELINTSKDALNKSRREYDEMKSNLGIRLPGTPNKSMTSQRTTPAKPKALAKSKNERIITPEESAKIREMNQKYLYDPYWYNLIYRSYKKDDVAKKNIEEDLKAYEDEYRELRIQEDNLNEQVTEALQKLNVIKLRKLSEFDPIYIKAYLEYTALEVKLTHIHTKKLEALEFIQAYRRKLQKYVKVLPPAVYYGNHGYNTNRPNVDTEIIPELQDLLSQSRHELREELENVENLSFQMEEKKSNLERAHEIIEKLNEMMKERADPQSIKVMLRTIEGLRNEISEEEQDYKAIKANFNIALTRLSKFHDQLDESTREMIRNQKKIQPNLSIPKNLNSSRKARKNLSLSQMDFVQRDAVYNFRNLKQLRHALLEEEKNSHNESKNGKYISSKLRKVSYNLMQVCSIILFRDLRNYDEEFLKEVRQSFFELKRAGYRSSRIALPIKRSMALSQRVKKPTGRLTKRAYDKRIANAFARMQKALS